MRNWRSVVSLVLFAAACDRVPASASVPALATPDLTIDATRCVRGGQDSSCALYQVSMYELIARAAAYHGKPVQVIGFAHFEFEGNALYAHRADWEHGITRNGLWMSVPDSVVARVQDRYVLVEGIFDAAMQGHFGMWSGSIGVVTRIVPSDPPKMPPLESIPTIDLKKR